MQGTGHVLAPVYNNIVMAIVVQTKTKPLPIHKTNNALFSTFKTSIRFYSCLSLVFTCNLNEISCHAGKWGIVHIID